MKNTRIILFIHIFCWLILAAALLLSHPPDWGNAVPAIFSIKQALLLSLLVVFFYGNLYFLVPRYLARQNLRAYLIRIVPAIALGMFFSTAVTAVFRLNADIIVYDPNHQPHTFPGYQKEIWNLLVGSMILLVVGLGITISFIRRLNMEVLLRQQVEQDKVTAELTALKAQINPHFFFNTLNNIYSYTLTDGEVAREAITSLSRMMRYVLYDTVADKVPLSQELAFIEEYVALMKLRLSEKTEVRLIMTEPVADLLIAPMLLLPFIENAFKHGASGLHQGYIHITISQTAQTLKLLVENSVHGKRQGALNENKGIGISNTVKRLELLCPEKFELVTGTVNETTYHTKLFIWS